MRTQPLPIVFASHTIIPFAPPLNHLPSLHSLARTATRRRVTMAHASCQLFSFGPIRRLDLAHGMNVKSSHSTQTSTAVASFTRLSAPQNIWRRRRDHSCAFTLPCILVVMCWQCRLQVHRIHLCFRSEDPFNFTRRIAAAYRSRDDALELIRYHLFIDCMRSEELARAFPPTAFPHPPKPASQGPLHEAPPTKSPHKA